MLLKGQVPKTVCQIDAGNTGGEAQSLAEITEGPELEAPCSHCSVLY